MNSLHDGEINGIPVKGAHMSKRTILVSAVALASVATVGLTAAPAGAATPSTTQSLSSIQAKAAAAITLRVNHLNAAVSKVNADSKLGSDAAGLVTYLQADIPGLQQLGQKIATDTSVTEASADARTIGTNYRVFRLVIPAARLAAESYEIDNNVVPKLNAASTKAASYENSSNQATVAPLLADLNSQISTVTSSTSGVATTVLGYTPVQWNANRALLAPSKSAVQSARTSIKKARSDLRQIRAAVKASR